MRKTYYKVVAIDGDGERVSVFADKHCLYYPPKTRVEADPNSIGIFVFDSYRGANNFTWNIQHKTIIIKVIGHGRPRKPKTIPPPSKIADYFYRKSWPSYKANESIKYFIKVPENTMCFPAITTLE